VIYLKLLVAALTLRMPWQEIEVPLAHTFVRKVKSSKQVKDIGLFSPSVQVDGGDI
jgi:hypothetical protein